MKLFGAALLAFLLGTIFCYGQVSSAPQPAPNALGHGAFPATVTKTLDSSKLKDGDSVELETGGSFKLPDGTLVPRGSKLIGHVETARARSKGDPDSKLTLVFEKLSIPGGKQLSLKGSVQAVYPPAEESMGPNMASAGTSQGGSGAGGGSGGVGITNANNGSDMESSNGQPVINMKATGVQGMHDLSLDNGVLSSRGKNVKLGGGVRIVVNAEILGYSPVS
jgi:hypothetical protein